MSPMLIVIFSMALTLQGWFYLLTQV
jgi:hypothetical protein